MRMLQGILLLYGYILKNRDIMKEIVIKNGGKVSNSIIKSTTILVVGDDPGELKIEKAIEKNISMLSYDNFMKLLDIQPPVQPQD